MQYEKTFVPPFNEGNHWAVPASPEVVEGMPNFFASRNSYPTDGRAVTYAMAYFSAKHLGAGQFYLMTIKDKSGRRLNGANVYRLTVPPDVPVSLYWSATAYDGATHTLIRNTRVVQPLIEYTRTPEERERLGRPFFRLNTARWEGVKLGADERRRRLRSSLPVLWSGKTIFQKAWVLPDIERME